MLTLSDDVRDDVTERVRDKFAKTEEEEKKIMSDVAVEALEGRNGWNTENGIPRKLKSLAYDLWGRDPKQCALCGTSSSLHLHHCAPEVNKYIKPYAEDLDPYKDTEPWQLVPLCPSCHRKVENTNFNLMNRVMWWAALVKAEEYSHGLEQYLEERKIAVCDHRRTPFDTDFWGDGE